MPPSISNEIPNPRYKGNHKSGAFCNRNLKCLLESKSVENNQVPSPLKFLLCMGKRGAEVKTFFLSHNTKLKSKTNIDQNRITAELLHGQLKLVSSETTCQEYSISASISVKYICVIRAKHPLQTEKPFLVLLFFTWID